MRRNNHGPRYRGVSPYERIAQSAEQGRIVYRNEIPEALRTRGYNREFGHHVPVRQDDGFKSSLGTEVPGTLVTRGARRQQSMWLTVEFKETVAMQDGKAMRPQETRLVKGPKVIAKRSLPSAQNTLQRREHETLVRDAGDFGTDQSVERREEKAVTCQCSPSRISPKCKLHAFQYTTGARYVCPVDGTHYYKRMAAQDCCTQCWEEMRTPSARAFGGRLRGV